MPFQDTPNKAVVRQYWDFPILTNWRASVGHTLSYFGLPGPDIKDLLDWKDLLGLRTGVEWEGRTPQQRIKAYESRGKLNSNIMAHGLSSGFQLLTGDIEDIIINGLDSMGKMPQLNDGQATNLVRFQYDLVNLDFCSGLGYRRESQHGDVKRVRAIKELFSRQQGQSFILFLTVSVRHTLGQEIPDYITGLRGEYTDAIWQTAIDWYLSLGAGETEYILKALVPSFIRGVAGPRMFKTKCYPPISYKGHGQARMVHFVFELEAQSGSLQAFGDQSQRDLLELPLLRCDEERITIPSKQHPNFDFSRCDTILDFLPVESKLAVLQSLTAAD